MPDPAPWTEVIRRRIAEGPVTYEDLLVEASNVVPPGRGYRTAINDVEGIRRRRGSGAGREFTDAEGRKARRIRYGQRTIAASAIHNAITRGRIQYADPDNKILVAGERPWGSPTKTRAQLGLTSHILRIVEHGPVSYDEALASGLQFIDRDRAIEMAIATREKNRSDRHARAGTSRVVTRPLISDERNFAVGSRLMFAKSIHPLRRSKRIEVTGEGENRIISRGECWTLPSD